MPVHYAAHHQPPSITIMTTIYYYVISHHRLSPTAASPHPPTHHPLPCCRQHQSTRGNATCYISISPLGAELWETQTEDGAPARPCGSRAETGIQGMSNARLTSAESVSSECESLVEVVNQRKRHHLHRTLSSSSERVQELTASMRIGAARQGPWHWVVHALQSSRERRMSHCWPVDEEMTRPESTTKAVDVAWRTTPKTSVSI